MGRNGTATYLIDHKHIQINVGTDEFCSFTFRTSGIIFAVRLINLREQQATVDDLCDEAFAECAHNNCCA